MRCILVEADAINPSTEAVETFRWAYLRPYRHTSAPGPYHLLVVDPGSWAGQPGQDLAGVQGASIGAAVIDNTNGDLDAAIADDWGFDRQEYRCLLADTDQAYGQAVTLFRATIARAVPDLALEGGRTAKRLRLVLQGPTRFLDEPVHPETYAGDATPTAGVGGTETAQGRRKRDPFSYVRNFEPEEVNPTLAIFDLGKSAVVGTAVGNDGGLFEGGIPLTRESDYADLSAMEGTAPSAGAYRLLAHTDGRTYARMQRPPAARVTAVVLTGASDADRTTAQTVQTLLARAPDAGSIQSGDVADLDAIAAGEVGIHPAAEATVRQALDPVLRSVDAYLAPARTGGWRLGRHAATTGSPVLRLVEPRPDQRPQQGDLRLIGFRWTDSADRRGGLPPASLALEYAPIERTQGPEDLLGDPTDPNNDPVGGPDRRARLKKATLRTDPATPAASLTARHKGARELVEPTRLRDAADATSERDARLQRRVDLRQGAEATVELTADVVAALDVGAEVACVVPTLGSALTTWPARVVAPPQVNARDLQVTLVLRGPRAT